MKRERPSSNTPPAKPSRRKFLAWTGRAAAGSAMAAMAVPRVHAGEDNTIRLALIGCGGRGAGAAANALSVPDAGDVKLSVMADLFENRLAASHKALVNRFADKIDVPAGRKFLGFDA